MEIIVAMAMPFLFLWVLFVMLSRAMLPGHADSVFIGHIARDIFWMAIRGCLFALMIPIRLVSVVLDFPRGHRSRPRRSRKRRRRR
jgi:hypothetical protein